MKITGVSTAHTTAGTVADSQSIEEDTKVSRGTVVTVVFTNNTNLGE